MVCLCFTFGWLCACGCLGFFSRFGLWLCVFHCLMMMSRNRWIHLMSQMMSLFFFFSCFPLLQPLSYVSLLFFTEHVEKKFFSAQKRNLSCLKGSLLCCLAWVVFNQHWESFIFFIHFQAPFFRFFQLPSYYHRISQYIIWQLRNFCSSNPLHLC